MERKEGVTLMLTPTNLKEVLTIHDAKFIKQYDFSCGNKAPIFEVSTMHALNQIIGHAKFNNREYGHVFYRGQCELYETLLPSLIRNNDPKKGPTSIKTATGSIAKQLKRVIDDDGLSNELQIGNDDDNIKKIKIEAILQHYGAPTRFIDLVDNHWIALWMGLYHIEKIKNLLTYYRYVERTIPYADAIPVKLRTIQEKEIYQYILLVAFPSGETKAPGVCETDRHIVVDLRQALPSTFLRPHAQHALVAKVKTNRMDVEKNYYDLAQNVVGIIRIRIDRAHNWVGAGQLLTPNNLFPPAAYDNGYDVLLSRTDLFDGCYSIARYI